LEKDIVKMRHKKLRNKTSKKKLSSLFKRLILYSFVVIVVVWLGMQVFNFCVFQAIRTVEAQTGVLTATAKAKGVILFQEEVVRAPASGELELLAAEGTRLSIDTAVGRIKPLTGPDGSTDSIEIKSPSTGVVCYLFDGWEGVYDRLSWKRTDPVLIFNNITDAIFKAALAVGGEDREQAVSLTLDVLRMLKQQYNGHVFSVEDVQDVVEKVLIEKGHARTAKAYILYRDKRTRMRDAKSELMDVVEDIVRETDRDNANVGNSPSAKMLQIASAASRNYYLSRLLDEDCSLAHQRGDIHIHDLDFYATTLNCLQIPLEELLSNGFDNGHGFIRPPKRPASATALSAIILQSSQNDMYGGQSFPFFDKQLAPYIDGEDEEEIYQAMEALVYNLNSMHSRAGSQVPFSSLKPDELSLDPPHRAPSSLNRIQRLHAGPEQHQENRVVLQEIDHILYPPLIH
jgi:hypothetical protein